MSKRKGPTIPQQAPTSARRVLELARRRAQAAADRPQSVARRDFVARAGVGAIAAMQPLTVSGIDGNAEAAGNATDSGARVHEKAGAGRVPTTLFFNLSHLGAVNTTHYV